MKKHLIWLSLVVLSVVFQTTPLRAQKNKDAKTVKEEHLQIGVGKSKISGDRNTHPGAQWFPDAGLGLFIHWSICSVNEMNISWPMIPGRPLKDKHITDPAERERIIREEDWNLNGKKPLITPNEYWEMAKSFNPTKYDPDKWAKAAKEAGFKYMVLTTRHHDGFALWPSDFGDFNTKNYMGGRDLVKDYVEACRRHGLKVGLYYSGPDWYFERDYMSFLYHGARYTNPEFPSLGPDLKPRKEQKTDEEIAEFHKEYARMVVGQIEELLTNYGQIDIIWFDGRPPVPNGRKVITMERMRQLQPSILVNSRLSGKGDFINYERRLTTDQVAKTWAEFCNPWTSNWAHSKGYRFRSNAFILHQFVTCRSLGINYLLGVGPMASGEFCDEIYENMAVVRDWLKTYGEAVQGTKPLRETEKASVPAVAGHKVRYLFLSREFKNGRTYDESMLPAVDQTVTLSGTPKPSRVEWLADGSSLPFVYTKKLLSVDVPAAKRSKLVDVIRVVY